MTPTYHVPPCLAVVSETAIDVTPFYNEFVTYLCSIPGHKFIVADSCYNVLRFTGQAKINETSVKAALNVLDYLCTTTDSTMIYLWHPSQAGQERGDASGWSVAWHNTPRARLSLTMDSKARDVFDLKVEKRNNGPAGGVLTLHWKDGLLVPRAELGIAGASDRLLEAIVTLALNAHAKEQPLTQQKNLYEYQMDMLEREAGIPAEP